MAIMGVACKLAVPRFIHNMMQSAGSYLLEPGDNTMSQLWLLGVFSVALSTVILLIKVLVFH